MNNKAENNATREIRCPLCERDNYAVLTEAKLDKAEYSFNYLTEVPSHYRIVRCRDCKMVYSNPIFSEEKILSLYRDSAIDKCIDSTAESIRINMCRYLERLSRFSGVRKGRILDIGCGAGHLLEYAASRGFEVCGVEPSVNAACHSRRIPGADIKPGAYTRGMYPPESFDLITAVHVIDHVVSPRELLLTAQYHLKPDGYLLVATHNTASWLGKISGKDFIAYHVQHVGYFDPGLLREMMRRCGLVPVKTMGSLTTYPLGHFAENGIRNRRLREMALKCFKAFNLSSLKLTLPMGNMEIICKKRKGNRYA